ncbi:MAG: hypothetical protein AN483_05405 [Aphanizomenon flos-aquae MDT14a]|jgi:hypothetical protein|nr:hypothetical protein [Aphanizomenon flos-aquae CP01]OBQ30404.1 MAG: hypothetical protein AN483_05405 [Aphanizomenon flos-aquae MDT14a]
MTKIPENIRLKELVIIANSNKPFFDDFINFLNSENYISLYQFVREQEASKAKIVLQKYLDRKIPDNLKLYDGIARPYLEHKAKWLILGWIFRDAPEQRLKPFLKIIHGTAIERKVEIINQVREYVSNILPEQKQWEWVAIFEVMIDRLEGSRRAIKGNLFEAIVRINLKEIFKNNDLELIITDNQVKIGDETYDVKISGKNGTILIPVKTRETMGGGHAHLFTRDIYKAITIANKSGFMCIPIIIAESWKGDINSLGCKNFVYIDKNPNSITIVKPLLDQELQKLLPIFETIN